MTTRADSGPVRIALVSASIRDDRLSPVLLPWLVTELASRDDVEVDLIDLAETDLPDERLLSSGRGAGGPLGDRVAAADGYLFLTPEYNHSYPAPLKRFLDAFHAEWAFTAATVVSYGVRGGLLAVEHLRGVLAELHVVVGRRVVGLAAPWAMLDDEGHLDPEKAVTAALHAALDELVWWADVLREARATRALPA